MQPDRPVRERGVVVGHAIDGQPAHEDEAAPPTECVAPRPHGVGERAERHVVAHELLARLAAPAERGDEALDLGDFRVRQRVDPVVAPRDVGTAPGGRRVDRRCVQGHRTVLLHRWSSMLLHTISMYVNIGPCR
jgi:hypothetical protein